MGLVSDGGVHSSLDHVYGILRLLRSSAGSGRSCTRSPTGATPRRAARSTSCAPLEARCRELGGCIATVSGRYYAMDRDKRWDRVARAYRAIVLARGARARASAVGGGRARAGPANEGDEFIQPIGDRGRPRARATATRRCSSTSAPTARASSPTPSRACSPRRSAPRSRRCRACGPGAFATLTEYDETFGLPALFGPVDVRASFGELVAARGARQLRIAETEKYAHVTYFFNGGREEPFANEDRILIPSPRDVPTYDLKPEMSAVAVTDALLEALGRARLRASSW